MSMLARFRTASPSIQIAAAVCASAILLLLLTGSYLLWFHSPYKVLFSDLRDVDAAAVVAELDKKKVPYELRDGGATILVPAKVVDATRLGLSTESLPLKGVVGFEIFNKSDMGLTEFAQQINYRRALQGELERTIMGLDGVDTARVHLTIAEPSVFRDDRRPSKASVTVIPRQTRVLPPETIRGIERLVAAAVPDLDPADVVVLDARGDVVSGESGAGIQAAAPQAQEKAAIEAYYAGRIRRALSAVDPLGHVGVAVSARTDPDRAGGDPFRAWTPTQRSFPLTVSLSLPSDGPVSSELRGLAARAIELAPDRGDSLTLSYVTPPTAQATRSPTIAQPPNASAAAGLFGQASRFWLVLLTPAAALIVVAVIVIRRLEAPRRLSVHEQDLYARRLTALIEGRDADAAPVS